MARNGAGFTHREYTDMLVVYGEAGRNAVAAARLYAERYPNRVHPRDGVFRRLEMRLEMDGAFYRPPVRARPRDVHNAEVVHFFEANPHASKLIVHMAVR